MLKGSTDKFSDLVYTIPQCSVLSGDFPATPVGIIGVPYDKGVALIGGRVGAAEAPSAIKYELYHRGFACFLREHNGENKVFLCDLPVGDFGNVNVYDDQERSYDEITSHVFRVIEAGICPIVIGGGHDISFAVLRALCKHAKHVSSINVDSHLDVREGAVDITTSGSHFRRSLDELDYAFKGDNFVEIGAGRNANSRDAFEYLEKQRSLIMPCSYVRTMGVKNTLRKAFERCGDNVHLSIDIDVLDQSIAPGCSAPSTCGLTSAEILELVFFAARSGKIKVLDLVEVNPRYDFGGTTVRIASSIIQEFVFGLYSHLNFISRGFCARTKRWRGNTLVL